MSTKAVSAEERHSSKEAHWPVAGKATEGGLSLKGGRKKLKFKDCTACGFALFLVCVVDLHCHCVGDLHYVGFGGWRWMFWIIVVEEFVFY